MPLFTKENAVEMGKRSHAPGSARFLPKTAPEPQRPVPAIIPLPNPLYPAEPAVVPDKFSTELTTVCEETLTLIRKAKQPMHRAQLARALRDLRETWHLATGKPRPGLTRPEMGKTNRTQMPRVYPGVYNPPGANTGNPGSTT